jgi:Zn2+/Cd2+-exporting ATPase
MDFRIRGMDCAEECAILRREVGPIVGGDDKLSFDILRGRMSVIGIDGMGAEAVVKAVGRTGMHAEPWTAEDDVESGGEEARIRRLRTLLTVASGVFGAAAFATDAVLSGGILEALGSEGAGLVHSVPWAARALYLVSIVCGTWYIAPRAWFAAKSLRPDMNLLMVIAVLGAMGIGEWFEAATVAFLFALSLALESWSVGRARRAVEALIAIAPETVRVKDSGGMRELPAKDVSVGTVFVVKPGERIALDGVVQHGFSAVNQAPITGESIPVPKEPGAPVFAGTINGDGALEVSSTKVAGQTTLANIIRMVGQAQARRAHAEQWVDRFARIYTPAVFLFAIAIGVVSPLLFSGAWNDWLYRALVLLVIGCPCALVISTPVSIVAALASAAKHGVLIKGGLYVEAPAKLRAIAMDKTGTLTEGHPAVVEIVAREGHTDRDLLSIVAGLEAHSDHPLARAIVARAAAEGRDAVDRLGLPDPAGEGRHGHDRRAAVLARIASLPRRAGCRGPGCTCRPGGDGEHWPNGRCRWRGLARLRLHRAGRSSPPDRVRHSAESEARRNRARDHAHRRQRAHGAFDCEPVGYLGVSCRAVAAGQSERSRGARRALRQRCHDWRRRERRACDGAGDARRRHGCRRK